MTGFYEISGAENLITGTSQLPDGTPIVFIDIPDIQRRYIWKCEDARKAGAHLIRQAETALIYSFIMKSMTDSGMTREQATLHVRELEKAISAARKETIGVPVHEAHQPAEEIICANCTAKSENEHAEACPSNPLNKPPKPEEKKLPIS